MRLFVQKGSNKVYLPHHKGIRTRYDFALKFGVHFSFDNEEFSMRNTLVDKTHVNEVMAEPDGDVSYAGGIGVFILMVFLLFFTDGDLQWQLPGLLAAIVFLGCKTSYYFDKEDVKKFNLS